MQVLKNILEPQHDSYSPTLENQSTTNENDQKTEHVDTPYFNQGQSAFHTVA